MNECDQDVVLQLFMYKAEVCHSLTRVGKYHVSAFDFQVSHFLVVLLALLEK